MMAEKSYEELLQETMEEMFQNGRVAERDALSDRLREMEMHIIAATKLLPWHSFLKRQALVVLSSACSQIAYLIETSHLKHDLEADDASAINVTGEWWKKPPTNLQR